MIDGGLTTVLPKDENIGDRTASSERAAERTIVINQVLEVIGSYRVSDIVDVYRYKPKATEPIKISISTYNALLNLMRHEVLALKGGTE